MNYKVGDIAKIVKGKLVANDTSSTGEGLKGTTIIKNLLIDSRRLISPENSLFFALITKRNDGHKYINELYQKGLRTFVISKLSGEITGLTEAEFIVVEDTLKALQALTAYHRKQFNYPVIGITGSNGKTIVKEWLFQLLNSDKNIVRSPKSYNSQIGVPLSVWQMETENDLAIFEAGISDSAEMGNLQAIIQPTIGIFTNIGHAHDENFINKDQKIGEKLKLFTKVEKFIYCSDYYKIKEKLFKSEILDKSKIFSWCKAAENKDADMLIEKIVKSNRSTTLQARIKTITNSELRTPNSKLQIVIPFTDDASIENAIQCWATMLVLGYEQKEIANRMLQLTPVTMRLELKEGVNSCSLIDDYYNLDIDSLTIALDFLNTQKQHVKKTVILSDILQSGRNEVDLYNDIARLINEKNVNRLIGIGKAISSHAELFKNSEKRNKLSTMDCELSTVFYNSTEDFIKDFQALSFHNETILLKGARVFQFELISMLLQQKTHETTLEINLNALINNLNYYRSLLKPETKIAAMVKAFSYGSGSFEIANTLQFHHADYLAVAYTDEGIELRKSGITTPVIVMNPEEQSFDAMFKYNLEPEIYNFRTLNFLVQSLQKNLLNYENAVSVHIKIDTGMYRLGFEHKDIKELIEFLQNNKQIHVKSIFSHLVASYDKQHDEFTILQIKRFTEMCDIIISAFSYPIMRHILNSAGIVRFPGMQFDMVRLGLGLYGVASVEEEKKYLENVSSLKTIISQIKYVPAGDTIGYGREYIAKNDMKIAVLPIGYADGLSRRLSNGVGKLMVNGKLASIIGNVSMDMCMIDITDVEAYEGEEVIIFGDSYPISNIASQLETIPYEILTSVSRRVKRVYFQE